MHKYQAWLNKFDINSLRQLLIAISVLSALGLGGYLWHNQQGKVNELKRQSAALRSQIPALASRNEKISLEKDLIALERDCIALENSIATSAVQTIGGLLLLVTAYVSWQNLKATERNVLVAEEKQVTERFTQAIDQLGSEEITTRIGGIYALERIAKDSPKDHWTIMEVLTSFVQEKSPLPDSAKPVEQQTIDSEKLAISGIAKDVQAALTVIGRRDAQHDPKEATKKLNLSRTDLSEADLSGADLAGAKLYFSCLYKVDLTGANLSDAQLNATALHGATLRNVNFDGTDLDMATFGRSLLNLTDFRGARNLTIEQIRGAFNWEQANYDDDFRQKLGLPPEQKS